MSWVAFSLLAWLLASIPISLVAGAAIAAGHDRDPAVDPAEERAPAPVIPLARAAARPTPA